MPKKTLSELLNFGFINIDKPTGPTSFKVSQYVKNSLNLKKTSHLGTLDPMVTGVLPVALGRACKLNEIFMHRDKVYIGIARFHESVEKNVLKKAMSKFLGEIEQLPPKRSSVKRALRKRTINKFEILEVSNDSKDVLFIADVQAGTYIRKLIHDLGESLGIGAHMLELRRIQAGLFNESKIFTLYDLDSAILDLKNRNEETLKSIIFPAESLIAKAIPKFEISNEKILKQLLTGKPLHKSDLPENKKLPKRFSIFNKEKFIGIYQSSQEKSSDIIAKPLFVFN
jgi:H/ACA ribonucleoprotein complex subunit 4